MNIYSVRNIRSKVSYRISSQWIENLLQIILLNVHSSYFAIILVKNADKQIRDVFRGERGHADVSAIHKPMNNSGSAPSGVSFNL